METTFAIFDTVTATFTGFGSTGTVPHENGEGFYVPNGGTFVFTTTDEAIARAEVAHLNSQVKTPQRYTLFTGRLG